MNMNKERSIIECEGGFKSEEILLKRAVYNN